MRPMHKFNPNAGRQYIGGVIGSYRASEIVDPIALAARAARLVQSPDLEDQCDAVRVIWLLQRALICFGAVWVCKSRYPLENGARWSDRVITWSAHLTRGNAEAWRKFWAGHFVHAGVPSYEWLPIAQEGGVELSALVHPDAPVGFGVSHY